MEIGELGLDIWRVNMISSLGEELVKQILEGIMEDRVGTSDNTLNKVNVIHGVIQSFVQVQNYKKRGYLKLYQDIFETPMLAASGAYYRSEASILLQVIKIYGSDWNKLIIILLIFSEMFGESIHGRSHQKA